MKAFLYRKLLPLYVGRDLPGVVLRTLDRWTAQDQALAKELRRAERDRRMFAAVRPQEAADRESSQGAEGDAFWLEIRRELRREGVTGPKRASGRAAVRAPFWEAHGGLVVRGALALGAILLAVWIAPPFTGENLELRGGPRRQDAALRTPTGGPTVTAKADGTGGSGTQDPAAKEKDGAAPTDAVEFPLEGWRVPTRDREPMDF